MATRIYLVKITASNVTRDGVRLVRASSQAAAIGHVMKGVAAASVATQSDLVTALSAGIHVEEADVAPAGTAEPETAAE